MRQRVTLALVGAALLAALAIDLLLLPAHSLEAALYAVAVLLAAVRLAPRHVLVVAALAIILDLVSATVEQTPLIVWVLGTLALLVVSVLAVQLARQRQETAQRARAAEEARQQLQTFMGMVSHDLRGPLTSVLGYAQVLLRHAGGQRAETEQRALEAIAHGARQMDRLIADLLDAARIGAGHFEVRPAAMDLVPVVRQVVEQQQETTTTHRLTVQAPARLEGVWDRDRLGQLLTNLVSNAIKYSPLGGEVRVAMERADDEALVRVSDQGVGISQEHLPLLFQPFSRLYQEREARGTGLGLYIAMAIVRAHRGRLWVESAPGKGSTFSIALPVEGPAERQAARRPAGLTRRDSSRSSADGARPDEATLE